MMIMILFSKRNLFLFPFLVLLLSSSGCTPPKDPILELIDVDLTKTKIDDLSRTFDFISSDQRFDQKEFQSKVSSGLNRWATYSTEKIKDVIWKLDPAAKPMLEEFSGLALLEQTDELNFLDSDAYYIQQAEWIKQITRRVTQSKSLGPFELYRLAAGDFKAESDDEDRDPVLDLVSSLHPELNRAEAEQLASALKIFDWLVRNIQLLPETVMGDDEIDDLRLNDRKELAAAGIPGTGYWRYPWQTLLYSRGDYVDRAKLFMLALQQIDIDSVMLAVSMETGDDSSADKIAAPQPWVVAVSINGDYFLFDTKLGLPLPGAQFRVNVGKKSSNTSDENSDSPPSEIAGSSIGSIATLAAIRKNPELISGLDLTDDESLEDDTKYWVRPAQLDHLVGLLYVAPESVARRMTVLESRLLDDAVLPLVAHPSEMIERLPKLIGLELKIWDIAFKTHEFRMAVREALEDTANNERISRLRWHYSDESYIDQFTRYRTARARFFLGKFESPRNSSTYNAIESFEKLIYTDEVIDSLATDSLLQQRLGILDREGADAADFNSRLKSVQQHMKLVRRDTGLFLAQSHFDNGSVSAAANWLKLLKDKEDAERWRDGIDYLLGRAYEARQEFDLAIKQYQENKAVQQAHGNLIRARILSDVTQ